MSKAHGHQGMIAKSEPNQHASKSLILQPCKVLARHNPLAYRSRIEPVKIGARSGIYRALYRPTGTRHQKPNPTNPRRSCQGVLSRGFRHSQSCGAETAEQWKTLIFTP